MYFRHNPFEDVALQVAILNTAEKKYRVYPLISLKYILRFFFGIHRRDSLKRDVIAGSGADVLYKIILKRYRTPWYTFRLRYVKVS